MRFNRRTVLATGAAALTAPMVHAAGHGKPRVVVIGGGAGGATAARYIAKDSDGAIDVTLIEPTRKYYTCFFSNLYIGGFKEIDEIGHTYGKLASDYGINVIHDWAVGIDRDAKTVRLTGGQDIPYDRLVVSPGIDFVEGSVPGWDLSAQNTMPHAYKGGSQTQLLRAQIEAMPEGGRFIMVAPPNPYRCPPGPYERVSMVAWQLSRNNPTAKILVVDPKESFSKQALFEEGWQTHYGGMVERIGPDFGGQNVSVDAAAMTVDVDGSIEEGDVINVIPAMKAGQIAQDAGLTEGNWAPVNPTDMTSKMDENIHVLGDATSQGDMPKSGFSANSQAKVASNAIRGALTDARVFPAKYANTCWSLIAENDGVKVGATYEPTDEKIAKVDGFVSQTGEDAALRKATYEESEGWYAGITSDMFG
ncbi:NAD(P)/FAD-dependent oxidoreductase [Rhodobacteraceae bacterium CCMM004]|nr:NAD(P)/FAD-dependent oxidoreductase [Rhodobacteraceae bacterium CCMM004]